MEGTQEDLGMSLFDMQDNLEINFDGIPEEYLEDEINTDVQPPVNTSKDDVDNINTNEDENPEDVVGDEEPEGDEEIDDSSPNPYSSFASVLSRQGLLPSLDLEKNEIKSEDDLAKVVKDEIDNQAKNFIVSKIGQDGYEALEKGVSLAEYQQHQDNILTLDGITDSVIEEDIELSKKIIYQDYLAQGMDENRAMRLLKRSIDAGDDSVIEDAKESLGSLKLTEAKRMEALVTQREADSRRVAAEQEKIDNDLKNAIYNTDEFIKGQKVNKATQDRVYQSITKIVGKNSNGVMENQLMKDRRENPIDFDTKLYYLYEITKGFKDFSLLESKTKTKASNELERALKGMKFDSDGTTPAYLSDPNSYSGGIGSEIVL